MRLVFFGTPPDAVPALHALVGAGHDVALVVTQPDRRRGRGGATAPSAVKAAALDLGISVATPARAREIVHDVAASGAELGVVVAFGQILPPRLLAALPSGFVNVHYSLLPRWRGAAPVERAMLAGDRETGVCVMALEAGLDTGPVYARRDTPIGPDETAGELRARLTALGVELLLTTLPRLGEIDPVPQAGEPTYAPKLTIDDFALDWSRPSEYLDRVVRAGNPRPGAWTTDGGRRLKVLRARVERDAPDGGRVPGEVGRGATVATGDGAVRLLAVQPEGRAVMPGDAWVAGRRDRNEPLGRGEDR